MQWLTSFGTAAYDGVDNACAATAQINTAGTWAAIGATELAARKRAYARAVAEL